MKVKELEAGMFSPWATQYANFRRLKRILNRCVAVKGGLVIEDLEGEEADKFKGDQKVFFFHVFDQQVDKVSAFFNTTLAHCSTRAAALAERTPSLRAEGDDGQMLHALEVLQTGAQTLFEDLKQLRDFAALNTDGLQWVIRKFDEKMEETHFEKTFKAIAHLPFLSTGPAAADALIQDVTAHLREIEALIERSERGASEVRLADRIVQRALAKDDSDALDALFSALAPTTQATILPALLREAAARGARTCVEQCLAWGASATARNAVTGDTAWHVAIQSGKSTVLETLIKAAAAATAAATTTTTTTTDSDATQKTTVTVPLATANREGSTPLHLAARLGDVACVRVLLAAGADANARNTSNNNTPLVDAVASGSLECVSLLLAGGADCNCGCTAGESGAQLPSSLPLSLAAANGRTDIVAALLAGGVDAALLDADEETALHKAARAGHLAVVQALLAARKDLVDVRSVSSRHTALFAAARHNRVEVVDALMDAGATLHLRDANGWMAEAHALYRGYNDLAERIQARNILTAPPGALQSKSPTPSPTPSPSPVPEADVDERRYGHRYLRDKSAVIVTLMGADIPQTRVRSKDGLQSDLSHCQLGVRVCEGKGKAVSAPSFHSLPVRIQDESTFYVESVDDLSVEFELVYIINAATVFARGRVARVNWRESRRDHIEAVCPLYDHDLNLVGEVSCSFLVVLPFKHELMAISKNTYWTIRQSYPVIGHRGAGAGKYARVGDTQWRTHVQENTLLSFVTAANFGAEYVEFDVQLTRDGVPVIYHNWTLTDNVGYYLPVNMISLKQFEHIRLPPRPSFTRAVTEAVRSGSRPRSLSDPKPLQGKSDDAATNISIRCESITLRDTLLHVPDSLGFNIEIKYPMPEERDRWQLTPTELNNYVDAILKCVFENVGNRKIFFSTFHPDVCRMLVLKQPHFPVFFLTCSGFWEKYNDPRAMSLRGAVRFASLSGAVGVVTEAKGLCQYPELIREVKSKGLLLLTWGKVNNDIKNIELQRAWGVDAIIADHVAHVRKSLVRDQPAFTSIPSVLAVKKHKKLAAKAAGGGAESEEEGEDKI